MRWQWKFDPHLVGYGFNAFFLGVHPYGAMSVSAGGVNFDTKPWLKRTSIVNPANNLCIGDSMPKSDGFWSSSLWWPTSCMDAKASTSKAFEGVDSIRHFQNGVALFNDGHAEARRDANINPPVDPSSGNAKGVINSQYWDPYDRARR